MAFVRIKGKVNGKGEKYYYAYLVENKWLKRRKQPKQTVKQYLGRAYKYDKKPKDFFDYLRIDDKESYFKRSFTEIAKDLIEWELYQHGTKNVKVDFSRKRITDSEEKPVVIVMNQGCLCDYTLKQLFSVKNSEDEREGYSLAKALVEAGIETPKEVFVGLYEKISKDFNL